MSPVIPKNIIRETNLLRGKDDSDDGCDHIRESKNCNDPKAGQDELAASRGVVMDVTWLRSSILTECEQDACTGGMVP